ncbi:MAG TPA: hypothetical protein VKF62_01960 [Planctomycetota bacterium]|nr:hypothetical protein [Planctomycetota bacterium]
MALLETLHREALASGAREAPVLVFPREEEMEALVGRNDRYWSRLLETLKARSVPFLDLSEALAPAYRAAREDPHAQAVYRAGHLSPFGNRIVADEVLAWISRRLPTPR